MSSGTTLRVGVLADLHVVGDPARSASWQNPYEFAGVEERCRRAARLFAREGVELVLLLGDLAHDGDRPSLSAAVRSSAAGVPVLVVSGNHDGPAGVLEQALDGSGARLAPLEGERVGGLLVAGLQAEREDPRVWRALGAADPGSWGDEAVLVASHFPVLSRAGRIRSHGLRFAGDMANREEMADRLRARQGPTVVVCGHLHVRDSCSSGRVLQLACGALVEPPFEATVLELVVRGSALVLSRQAHELDSRPEERNPRIVPAREAWRHTPGRGWRREPAALST